MDNEIAYLPPVPGKVFLYHIEDRINKLRYNKPVPEAVATPKDDDVIDVLLHIAEEKFAINFDDERVKWGFDLHRSIDGLHVILIWVDQGTLPTLKPIFGFSDAMRLTLYTDKKSIGWY